MQHPTLLTAGRSIVKEHGAVRFPEWSGERVYMVPFLKSIGLPRHLSRWQPTVDAMLDSVHTELPIYLMVDQGIVHEGISHRRPGVHFDGYWNPHLYAHGGRGGHVGYSEPGGGGHGGRSGSHDGLMYEISERIIRDTTPKKVPKKRKKSPTKKPKPKVKKPRKHAAWTEIDLSQPEGLILASDVQGCGAFTGDWCGPVGYGGECSLVNVARLGDVVMQPNRVYVGNVGMLHESLPMPVTVRRTLVRLNVPGWSPNA